MPRQSLDTVIPVVPSLVYSIPEDCGLVLILFGWLPCGARTGELSQSLGAFFDFAYELIKEVT